MLYFKHIEYGYIAASNPPRKHGEEYIEITKEEFDAYIKQQEEKEASDD